MRQKKYEGIWRLGTLRGSGCTTGLCGKHGHRDGSIEVKLSALLRQEGPDGTASTEVWKLLRLVLRGEIGLFVQLVKARISEQTC